MFKIFIDKPETSLLGSYDPFFLLETTEEELCFLDPVIVDGKAYIAGQDLILELSAKTMVTMPCKICNKPAKVPLQFEKLHHVEPLKDLKDCFDYTRLIRENLLLEIPLFAECDSNCKERTVIEPLMKKQKGHCPFSTLK